MASATNSLRNNAPSVAGATTALVLLTALNFVNYIDRYILPGVQEQIKQEFLLDDRQIGSLTFWFMIAYMFTSPITGFLGDRFPRKPMIVIAALFWSWCQLLHRQRSLIRLTQHSSRRTRHRRSQLRHLRPCRPLRLLPRRSAQPRPHHLQYRSLRRRRARLSHRRHRRRALRLAQVLHRLCHPRHPYRYPHRHLHEGTCPRRQPAGQNQL